MKLLHIDSSIQGAGSASRELTREIVARWVAERPDTEVTYLDLAAEELPHLSQKSLVRADELEAARNAEALEQFLAADVIVIGAPVYNFTIPSQLKAWIDRITVAGQTFRYTESGPQGLAGGKQVIVAVARGGVRAPDASGEFGEPYLRFLRISRYRQREIRARRGPGDFTAAARREPERRARRDRRLQRDGGLMAAQAHPVRATFQ